MSVDVSTHRRSHLSTRDRERPTTPAVSFHCSLWSFLPTRPDDPSPARVPGPTDPLLSRWISWRFPESHPSAVTSTQRPGAGLGSALWSGGSRRSLIRARVDGFGVASSVSAVGNHAAANVRAPVSTRAFISRVRTPGPSPGAGGRLTF